LLQNGIQHFVIRLSQSVLKLKLTWAKICLFKKGLVKGLREQTESVLDKN